MAITIKAVIMVGGLAVVFLQTSFVLEHLIAITAPPVALFHVLIEFVIIVEVLLAVTAVRVVGTVHIVREKCVPRCEVPIALPAHPVSRGVVDVLVPGVVGAEVSVASVAVSHSELFFNGIYDNYVCGNSTGLVALSRWKIGRAHV